MTISWVSFWAFLFISLATHFAFGDVPLSAALSDSVKELAQAQAEYAMAMNSSAERTPASVSVSVATSTAPEKSSAGKEFSLAHLEY